MGRHKEIAIEDGGIIFELASGGKGRIFAGEMSSSQEVIGYPKMATDA